MKKVLLTSQSGVLRKVASQTQGPGDYTYEYTKQTEHSQQQTSSGLFQTCFLSCSRPPAFFLFTVYQMSEFLLLNLSFGQSYSVYFNEILASHIIFQGPLLLLLPVSVYSFWIRIQWGSLDQDPDPGGQNKNDPQKWKS
jgi:hypothetical protein